MPRPLQICIGASIAVLLVGGCKRGGAGLRESGSGGELAFKPRPRRVPAPSWRELAAPPAASGGRPGRCDPGGSGVAGAIAAGHLPSPLSGGSRGTEARSGRPPANHPKPRGLPMLR